MYNVRDLVEILRYQIDSLPSTFLGLPIGSTFKRKETWNPVKSRIRSRLGGMERDVSLQGGQGQFN